MSSIYSLFVTCPKGLENLLTEELTQLGGQQIRQTVAGVRVEADLVTAYRLCLWSRLANKVLLSLGQCAAENADQLYRGIASFDWTRHLSPDASLWVDLSGTNEDLRNTQHSAQVVKDAIVDQLRTPDGVRPSVSKERPDLTVSLRLYRGQAAVNIDLCGESLHRRGYRQRSVVAPLKENLAAALLLRAGWPLIAAQGGSLIDPMCGSGTLLTEAAMQMADIAPGIWRKEFAFERWLQHRPSLWSELKREAEERRERGLAKNYPEIRGYDTDPRAVTAANANIAAAGLDKLIWVMHKPLAEFARPSHGDFSKGLLITNPPYGERLGEQQALLPLYGQLGDILKRDFSAWNAAVITGNPELGKSLGLRSQKQYKFYNGTIASELLLFEVFAKEGRRPLTEKGQYRERDLGEGGLGEGAQMVANRLQKNLRQLQPWVKGRGVNCYRLYDADLPEYAAAIDVYADKVHIQEYQAPKSIDESKAQQRLDELVQATRSVLKLRDSDYSLKQRRRNRGKQQYERIEAISATQFDVVAEGRAKFAVNL
jgi:23S rRNA (guanine2445-N2)-methyltransferase / 23S rRNA (guanine2069-N7)-methyltransferase